MKLKEYLKTHRVNQSKFARAVGVNKATIHRISKGGDIYLSTAMKIVKESQGNVTLNDFLTDKEVEEIITTKIQKQEVKHAANNHRSR